MGVVHYLKRTVAPFDLFELGKPGWRLRAELEAGRPLTILPLFADWLEGDEFRDRRERIGGRIAAWIHGDPVKLIDDTYDEAEWVEAYERVTGSIFDEDYLSNDWRSPDWTTFRRIPEPSDS